MICGVGRVGSVQVWGGSRKDFSNSCGAGLNFAGAGWERTKYLNPCMTLIPTVCSNGHTVEASLGSS